MNRQIEVEQLKFSIINGARQPTIGLARITILLPKPLIKKIQDKMKNDETRSSTITRLIQQGIESEHNEQHR